MTRVYLSLGSNLDDRLGHLQQAVAELEEAGLHVAAVSAVYETDPVGGPAQGRYLNIVAAIDTYQSASEVLELCHAIEDAHRRTRDQRWGPRTLDIDILTYGDIELDSPELTVPHPRAHERAFVLVPWFDLDPDAQVGVHGTVGEVVQRVGRSGVRLHAPTLGAARRS
jgi:2-amino-4-hydroxy-6-hydroxymethyldihydropteridine diphosphokinase